MKLFDESERYDESPAFRVESQFRFLNRAGRRDFGVVRGELESWFREYPAAARKSFRGQFRSRIDSQHRSAFFELFLHRLLCSLGGSVQVHPSLEGRTRKPDFLVRPATGQSFYMEAVLATSESKEEGAARARLDAVYDALDRIESPNFFLDVEVDGTLATSVDTKPLRAFLTAKLAALDPDVVQADFDRAGGPGLPSWKWSLNGLNLHIRALPKGKARGKRGQRTIGMHSDGAHWADSVGPIKTALESKTRRYGDLGAPYVIAVNALEGGLELLDIINALYGDEAFVITMANARPAGERFTRKANGFWTSNAGPRHKEVSAVLIAAPALPWNVPRTPIWLCLNPWAERPLDGELTRLPQVKVEADKIKTAAGESLADIFNLSPQWPEE